MKTEQHSTTQHSKAKLALGEPAGEGDDGKHCFSTQVLLHNWMLPSPHALLTKQFSIIHFRKCKTQKCRGISQMHFFLRNCYSNVSFLYRMFVERMKVDNSGVSTLATDTKLLPAAPASRMGASSGPGCSTSDPAPC